MKRALTSREKLLAALSGILVLGAILWTVVVEPARETRARSLAHLAKLDAIEQILVSQPFRQSGPEARTNGPISRRITDTARAAAIEIQRLDPQGTALGVTLERVSFPALVAWIETLNINTGIHVRSAEIARLTEPGTVSARLLFEEAR